MKSYSSRLICGLAALSLAACKPSHDLENTFSHPQPDVRVPTPHKNRGRKEKVLLIGIDGLRPDALQKASAPSLDYLIENGAYGLESLTGLHSLSGPGWSTVFTGVDENKHRVTENSFNGNDLCNHPNIFEMLKTAPYNIKTASFVSWLPLQDYFMGSVDRYFFHPYNQEGDFYVAEKAAQDLSYSDSDFTFVYFSGIDMAGHAHGFHPSVDKYIKAIEKVDSYISTLLDVIHSRPKFNEEDWLYLAVTDHGGNMKGHGGKSFEERNVFYIVSGHEVQKGIISPSPSQVDVVPTILEYFSIPIKKEWNLDGIVMR